MSIVPKDQATLEFSAYPNGRKVYLAPDPQIKTKEDGATGFPIRVKCRGDHVSPSGGGSFSHVQREVSNQASPGLPQGGLSHYP